MLQLGGPNERTWTVGIGKIELIPCQAIAFVRTLGEPSDDGHERRECNQPLEQRTPSEVNFHDYPISAADLGDELLDTADVRPIGTAHATADEVLDIHFDITVRAGDSISAVSGAVMSREYDSRLFYAANVRTP